MCETARVTCETRLNMEVQEGAYRSSFTHGNCIILFTEALPC